jgi:multiple antibiotic resistance protein
LISQYDEINILIGVFLNKSLFILFSSEWIEKMLGQGGTNVLRKVFGVILLAIAIKIIKTRLG